MNRPLILLVANGSWNLAHFRGPLIHHLAEKGYVLHAAIPRGDEPVGALPSHPFPLRADGTHPVAEARSVAALAAIIRRVKPQAVLTFTPKGNIYGGIAARLCGRLSIPNISGLGTGFIEGGLLQRIQTFLYRAALRDVPTVFFQNADDRALFESLGLVRSEQARLLPGSGVDCARFAPTPLAWREPGEAHLLFVGRLLGDKGLRELAGAMRCVRSRFPRLRLTLVGDTAANRSAIAPEELRGWVDEGLLEHAGRTADVRPFIAAADAVVLPSYREGMPRALLEAAAMGRPLLASNVPGCRTLVRDGENGLLFEARSEASLASAITRFMEATAEQRQAWSDAAARMAAEEYDERLVFAAYDEALIALKGKSR